VGVDQPDQYTVKLLFFVSTHPHLVTKLWKENSSTPLLLWIKVTWGQLHCIDYTPVTTRQFKFCLRLGNTSSNDLFLLI